MAVIGLLVGTADGAEWAVARLETAMPEAPRDAGAWNDLAAAYLVRSHFRHQPYDLLRALAAAEHAVEAHGVKPQALFNRALILENLGLRAAAAAAWRRFLAVGDSPGWMGEAKDHLARLSLPVGGFGKVERALLRSAALQGNGGEVRRLAALSPQAVRELACDEMLPDWAEAFLRGDLHSANEVLAGVRALGNALEGLGGDRTVAESVRAVERATIAGSTRHLTDLARAHLEYREGLLRYRSLRVEAAAPKLRRARTVFAGAGSPMELWTESLLSGIELSLARPERAVAGFEALLKRADPRITPALSGRLFWGLGLVRVRQGRMTEGLIWYGKAAAALHQAREEVNEARIEALSAEALKYLGQAEPAWVQRARALTVLGTLSASRELHGELWEAADALLEEQKPGLALVFQEEDVEVARRSSEPFMQAEAALRLSRVLSALGKPEEALQALTEARVWNSRGGSTSTSAGTSAQIDLEEGEIRRRADPAGAQRLLDRALERLIALGRPLEMQLAYLGRARVHLVVGREGAGEADLHAALRLVTREEAAITEPAFRQSFAETAQRFFDELILLRSRRDHLELSTLEAIEEAKNLDSDPVAGSAGDGLSVAGLTAGLRALPGDVALVELGLVEDRLFQWTLRRRGVELEVHTIDRATISGWVKRFVEAVRTGAGDDEIARASEPLRPLLVPGGGAKVHAGERLVFIPDGDLHLVPFAALRDPKLKRYLVEDHVVSVAPSATAYLNLLGRRQTLRWRDWSALLVDDPQFDRLLFPDLARLVGTRAETEQALRLFPGSQVVTGQQATGPRLLQEIGRHEILGFAGHAVANDRVPLESYLILAPTAGGGDSGRLFARDLAGRRFGALRLVVLSACSTAVGVSKARGTGFLGLTGPFLEGGADAVMATLWNVDDRAAGPLVADFYRRFHLSGDAAGALREVQLAALHGEAGFATRSPGGWASFQLVGELRPKSPRSRP